MDDTHAQNPRRYWLPKGTHFTALVETVPALPIRTAQPVENSSQPLASGAPVSEVFPPAGVSVSLSAAQLKLLRWILSDHIESIERDPQYLDPECIPELDDAIEDVEDIQRLLIAASETLGGCYD